MKIRTLISLAAVSVLVAGCATHQTRLSGPIQLVKNGRIQEALAHIEPLAKEDSRDQLLYLMEYGTLLHDAGRFDESSRVFIQADKLSDQVDFHSVSKVAVATLGSEEMLQYKGESYEKLMINVYNALNFLMMNQYDAAMVEVRRINDKVKKFRAETRENYELNPFATYLSALIWEGDQRYDDAYIAYERTHALDGSHPALPEDLVRSAKLARRLESHQKWLKQFPHVQEDPDWYDKKLGEVILLFGQGWGPRKTFSYDDHRFPRLVPEPSSTRTAKLVIAKAGKTEPVKTTITRMIYNVEQASMQTLQADYSNMVARKLGAFAAKEIVADQIRQKDELMGLVARLVMHASDRADLRHWTTLPQTFQIARVYLPPGEYSVSAQGFMDSSGAHPTADAMAPRKVKVVTGRKKFIAWRSLR